MIILMTYAVKRKRKEGIRMELARSRILIISASIGTGHTKAAQAIAMQVRRRYPEAVVETVDFMADGYYLHRLIKESYLKMLHLTPNMYDVLYRWTKSAKRFSMQGIMARAMKRNMKELLDRHRPDIVICTHPFPCSAVAYLKKTQYPNLVLTGVITDFAVHQMWIFDEVDLYFIGSADMLMAMVAKGVSRKRVAVTGIPVLPSFSEYDRTEPKAKDGRQLPNVLIMGGGLGMGGVQESLHSLEQIARSLRIVVIAGRKKKLRRKLEKFCLRSHHSIRIYEYTDRIPELMANAQLLITKPGALTISEALTMELPMILFDPIPGQEIDNARFLEGKGAAVWVRNGDDIAGEAFALLTDTERHDAMRARARALRKPYAAAQIVRYLEEWNTEQLEQKVDG